MGIRVPVFTYTYLGLKENYRFVKHMLHEREEAKESHEETSNLRAS